MYQNCLIAFSSWKIHWDVTSLLDYWINCFRGINWSIIQNDKVSFHFWKLIYDIHGIINELKILFTCSTFRYRQLILRCLSFCSSHHFLLFTFPDSLNFMFTTPTVEIAPRTLCMRGSFCGRSLSDWLWTTRWPASTTTYVDIHPLFNPIRPFLKVLLFIYGVGMTTCNLNIKVALLLHELDYPWFFIFEPISFAVEFLSKKLIKWDLWASFSWLAGL